MMILQKIPWWLLVNIQKHTTKEDGSQSVFCPQSLSGSSDQDGCSAARTTQAILRDPDVAAQPPALKLPKGARLSSEEEDEGAKGSAAVAKALRLK